MTASRDTLYHMRSVNAARDNVVTGTLRLNSLSTAERTAHIRAGLPEVGFFLSLARNRNSHFFQEQQYVTNVVYELDGRKLNARYKIKPIQYYQTDAENRDEMEERLISSQETIDLRPYLLRVDIILGKKDVGEEYGLDYEHIVEEMANFGVPVLLFANYADYLKNKPLPTAVTKTVTPKPSDPSRAKRRPSSNVALNSLADFSENANAEDQLRKANVFLLETQHGVYDMTPELTVLAKRMKAKTRLSLAEKLVTYWSERVAEQSKAKTNTRLMALVPEIQNFANSQGLTKIAQINTREELAMLAEHGAVLPFDYPWWEIYAERLNKLTEQQEKLKKKDVVQAAVNDILAQYTTILTQLKHQLGDGGVDLLRTLAKNGHFELPDLTDDFEVSSEVAANISAVIKDVFDDTVTDCFQIRRALRAMFNRVLV